MDKLLQQPQIWEDGDRIFICTPLAPFGPAQSEVEEFAFAEQLKEMAPNDHIMWLRGHYVEADKANRNGQQWTAGELALKQLTPRLMPVTVMHDPRTAVGLIADAKLSTPDADEVSRSRIDTSLAIWKHRFPEIAEECMANHEAGTLMQSMECLSPHYSCSDCGKTFPKLPDHAEEEYWCDHLKGVGEGGEQAGRILGNVTFTGTGLIFGTRGSQGAYTEANLDVFQDEVAEFHTKAHETTRRTKPRSKTSMETIEIPRTEYAELQQRPSQEELAAEKTRADEADSAKAEAEKKVEEAEVAKKTAEDAKEEADKKLKAAEDKSAAEELAKDRMGKLGAGFAKKLPDSVKEKLNEQAGSLKDEEWTARLEELSKLVGVKPDEGAPEGEGAEQEFTAEEVASAGVGKESTAAKEPSKQVREGVFSGLFEQHADKAPEASTE